MKSATVANKWQIQKEKIEQRINLTLKSQCQCQWNEICKSMELYKLKRNETESQRKSPINQYLKF